MCGSSKSSTPAVDPTAQAKANLEAQIATLPGAAQTYYNIQANPQYGLGATTQLQEDVRQKVFPGEQAVRGQTQQNILQALQSPIGATPQQIEAQNKIRQEAIDMLQQSVRSRANLGGNLFSGGAQRQENRAVTDLTNQFAVEDISRDETSRLNAINAAMPYLQLLFPGSQITQPQFINPVASADTQFGGAVSQRGQDLTYQAAQQAAQSQLYGSLFKGLGGAAGGYLGGAAFDKMMTA